VDLKAAKQPTKVGTEDIDFHATRRSFLTWLTNAEVSAEIIDMLAGHAGKGVRVRHYTARDLEVMAKAVAKIELHVSAGEVVSLPLAVAVGDDSIIDDVVPTADSTSVAATEDTEIIGLLPAEVPAPRGKCAGSATDSIMISSAPGASRTRDLRFRNNDIARARATCRTAELLGFSRVTRAGASLSIWPLPECCPPCRRRPKRSFESPDGSRGSRRTLQRLRCGPVAEGRREPRHCSSANHLFAR
jgi:hypothetical protein